MRLAQQMEHMTWLPAATVVPSFPQTSLWAHQYRLGFQHCHADMPCFRQLMTHTNETLHGSGVRCLAFPQTPFPSTYLTPPPPPPTLTLFLQA